MHAAATEAQSAALRTLLRSFGQIVLQPNAFTGASLLAAWLLCDPRLACAALMGAVAANVSALLAGYQSDDTRAGLHGFNGALAGLAAFSFIADNATAAAVAILAATATAWLLEPWSRWLRARGLGVFSSPCLIITWLWLPLVTRVAQTASLTTEPTLGAAQLSRGWLAGFAQTGFASGALPGLLVLIGIAAASRRHALWALVGAGLASAMHLLLGASASSFDAGLLGFNGTLTAIALADCGIAVTLGGVVLSVVLQAAAAYYALPAMTAPFVLATWSMQWLTSRFTHGAAVAEPAKRAAAGRRVTSPASVRRAG
ncbi:Urea transporter [Paraburkholderia domus]|jgi:Urea transporter|uniref:Urea transporter n=1 Tax=Paraburkholderia domus TaxID=2793075 RepID=A0A9N8MWK1_9BURK|nr:urea transporter [Paraburkholderia domus]MBK5051558.1 urea transporter [Burkholderia sp. R-70006]MBK5063588.1 urea transporter [Burkholderia sp. R-70199]MBK5089609.1 urea transporter [Burkholderia sp. R-69927]MBK5122926.1 urea transporter [Burkholderia sp. R-69980]MBK5165206.1 urea transporter [Burkholderia sp. R-70211]MBK5182662.1 urea transporter [Burkholderia sp. R-69749]MCI0148916.1 urea transporter [Paraburkholderia sediminicola]